jgi:predicted transcriptional regulator
MKAETIRVVGKQVFANQDELEEGYVEIELEAYDILREIDNEDVADYARWSLDMKHEDDFESSLEDFDDDELIKELESNGYNFSKQIGEDDCIEFLEESGYTVSEYKEAKYDYIDMCLFDDIVSVFDSLDVFSRQKLRDLVVNFK